MPGLTSPRLLSVPPSHRTEADPGNHAPAAWPGLNRTETQESLPKGRRGIVGDHLTATFPRHHSMALYSSMADDFKPSEPMSALSGEIAVPSLVIGQPSDIDVKDASLDDLEMPSQQHGRRHAMLQCSLRGRCQLAVLQLEGWWPISPATRASNKSHKISSVFALGHWAQHY